MKSLIKFLVLPLLFLNSLFAAEIYTDLLDFARLTSKANNIAIVTDESIHQGEYYFIYEDEVKITIAMFRKMLEAKNLYLYKKDNFYYVSSQKLPDYDLRRIELKNYVYDDVNKILGQFDLNATYSTSSIYLIKLKKPFQRLIRVWSK